MYPTQAKKRLEWATVSFAAAPKGPAGFSRRFNAREKMRIMRKKRKKPPGKMRKKRIKPPFLAFRS